MARRSALPLLLAVAAAACHGGGAARLEGRWRGVNVEGVAPEAAAAAQAFAAEMEIEVRGETITVTTAHDRQTGKYSVDSEDKQSVTLYTDRDGKADKQTFVFINDRTMKWAVVDGKPATITFSKL